MSLPSCLQHLEGCSGTIYYHKGSSHEQKSPPLPITNMLRFRKISQKLFSLLFHSSHLGALDALPGVLSPFCIFSNSSPKHATQIHSSWGLPNCVTVFSAELQQGNKPSFRPGTSVRDSHSSQGSTGQEGRWDTHLTLCFHDDLLVYLSHARKSKAWMKTQESVTCRGCRPRRRKKLSTTDSSK